MIRFADSTGDDALPSSKLTASDTTPIPTTVVADASCPTETPTAPAAEPEAGGDHASSLGSLTPTPDKTVGIESLERPDEVGPVEGDATRSGDDELEQMESAEWKESNGQNKELEALLLMKKENDAQIEEVRAAGEALVELRRKRNQLDQIRATLMSALKSGRLDDPAALDKLLELEEEALGTATASIPESIELRSRESNLEQRNLPTRPTAMPHNQDLLTDEAAFNDIVQQLAVLDESDQEAALSQLARLKLSHEAHSRQLQELTDIRDRRKEMYDETMAKVAMVEEKKAESDRLMEQLRYLKSLRRNGDSGADRVERAGRENVEVEGAQDDILVERLNAMRNAWGYDAVMKDTGRTVPNSGVELGRREAWRLPTSKQNVHRSYPEIMDWEHKPSGKGTEMKIERDMVVPYNKRMLQSRSAAAEASKASTKAAQGRLAPERRKDELDSAVDSLIARLLASSVRDRAQRWSESNGASSQARLSQEPESLMSAPQQQVDAAPEQKLLDEYERNQVINTDLKKRLALLRELQMERENELHRMESSRASDSATRMSMPRKQVNYAGRNEGFPPARQTSYRQEASQRYDDGERSRANLLSGNEIEATYGKVMTSMQEVEAQMQELRRRYSNEQSVSHREHLETLFDNLQDQLSQLREVQAESPDPRSRQHIVEEAESVSALPRPRDPNWIPSPAANANIYQPATESPYPAQSSFDANNKKQFFSIPTYDVDGAAQSSYSRSESSPLKEPDPQILRSEKKLESPTVKIPTVIKSEVDSEENSPTKRLFAQYRDKIYKGAANVVTRHEEEPYFLLQLFRGVEKLDSSYLRQRLLLALDDLLEEKETLVKKEVPTVNQTEEQEGAGRDEVDEFVSRQWRANENGTSRTFDAEPDAAQNQMDVERSVKRAPLRTIGGSKYFQNDDDDDDDDEDSDLESVISPDELKRSLQLHIARYMQYLISLENTPTFTAEQIADLKLYIMSAIHDQFRAVSPLACEGETECSSPQNLASLFDELKMRLSAALDGFVDADVEECKNALMARICGFIDSVVNNGDEEMWEEVQEHRMASSDDKYLKLPDQATYMPLPSSSPSVSPQRGHQDDDFDDQESGENGDVISYSDSPQQRGRFEMDTAADWGFAGDEEENMKNGDDLLAADEAKSVALDMDPSCFKISSASEKAELESLSTFAKTSSMGPDHPFTRQFDTQYQTGKPLARSGSTETTGSGQSGSEEAKQLPHSAASVETSATLVQEGSDGQD
ncbi:Phosphoacetylglucosamine Mutase [Borealophlyctis nickersoniae]|nr:Phosphoacetylglucosamine Mutase [Borealophlyctis nickersoniae]